MSDVVIYQRFRVKRDTAANFTAANTVLLEGEFALETDTRKLKLGDGTTAWNDLDYIDAAFIPYDNTTSELAATDVQTAVDELQAAKLGDAPSDGNTYGRKDAAWVNVESGGSGLTLMGSATVAGSAATDLTVSGLDLASDGAYLLLVNIGNATASSATISLFYNGDTTATNYYFQFWSAAGATSNASRTNVAAIASIAANASLNGVIELQPDLLDGYPRALARFNRFAPASIELVNAAHIRNNSANVTSITISSSVASALAVGSYIKVYKLG